MTFTAEQIAAYVGGTVEGDAQARITTFAKIEEGVPGAISFLANPKYEEYLYTTDSSVELVNRDFELKGETKATLVRVDNAYESIARLLAMYEQATPKKTGVSPQAFVAESATIGDDVYIGPFAVVEDGATIGRGTQIHPHTVVGERAVVGDDCTLYANVTIYHDCKVGNRCILHAGSVIGADGFGFAPTADGYEKIAQIGIVTIEDDCEVGANTCVDRSTMGTTILRRGVKLDNLVQIAHNVEVGANTVMSAQVGVAGSTKIGQWCMFGGQVGISGHSIIGDRTMTGAQAGIAGGTRGNCTIMGSPAFEAKQFMRASAVFKHLPELKKTIEKLEKEVEALHNA